MSGECYPKYLISDECFSQTTRNNIHFKEKNHNNAKIGSQKNR
jgi:hypothetical protein